ncbi:hypothetical protein EIN_264890 [Entamoeba invadens IP1]|uniref:Uncharacterized protein n=1 Tax=Entamoeba invadens IP1 TaxID=370355 RepID=A0A0A1TWV2_ENTIV|nr:hypothetical protein EIN_264890 [Entamoeba invadens IP1]ELP85702.1 hypothetical protein EIN_264890 [Entamoeba invadens IP1]|eukprot:XP_004185048.1 hypothetical protein EIN_264890 [Entamoeba invadens IP1]
MFIYLLFIALNSAKYAVSTDSTQTTVVRLGQCYYIGSGIYVKAEEDGEGIRAYESNVCGNWVDKGKKSLSPTTRFEKDLPLYKYVIYDYMDAKNCKISEKGGHPLETLYKECQKEIVGSTKSEIKDGIISRTYYLTTSDCTGISQSLNKIELNKCNLVGDEYITYSQGAYEIFAFLALLLVCLF